MSIPELNCKFAIFINGLIETLESFDGALPRMKRVLEHLVLPLHIRKFVRIVRSEEYKSANSVSELFRLLAPHWNCIDCNFLRTLVKASECQEAEEKLDAFLQSRDDAASSLILQKAHAPSGTSDVINHGSSDDPTEAQPVAKSNISSQDHKPPHQPGAATPTSSDVAPNVPHTSVHNTPDEKATDFPPTEQCIDEPVFTQPQPLSQVEMEAKVDTDVLTLSDYDKGASILCGVLKLPRFALSFFGTGTGCISIRWHMSSDLLPYVLGVRISESELHLLAEQKIVQIRVGEDFVLAVPTLSYWKKSAEASVSFSTIYGGIFKVKNQVHHILSVKSTIASKFPSCTYTHANVYLQVVVESEGLLPGSECLTGEEDAIEGTISEQEVLVINSQFTVSSALYGQLIHVHL